MELAIEVGTKTFKLEIRNTLVKPVSLIVYVFQIYYCLERV